MVACTGTSVEQMRGPVHRAFDVLGHGRPHGVEVARAEEFRTVPKLRWTVAARCRPASPATQEIGVALARKIEAVPILADERACRSGKPRFTKRAPQEPVAEPRSERRHGAAPPARRRTGNRSS